MKFKAALKNKVAVLLDERDQKEIDKRGMDTDDDPAEPRQVSLSQQVSHHGPNSPLVLTCTGPFTNYRQLSR